jgi:DNA-binding XRE family transcriptional regulator
MEDATFLTCFLPDAIPLHLDSWQLDDTASLITLHVTSTQHEVPCPVCAVFTPRVHSRYTCTRTDLPWGAARVRWQLRVRTFVCANTQCPRRLFTGRLPEVAYIDLKLALSAQLKQRRQQQKLTQVELANRLQSDQSRVAKIEAGDPSVSLDLLIRSLLALELTPTDLACIIAAQPSTAAT